MCLKAVKLKFPFILSFNNLFICLLNELDLYGLPFFCINKYSRGFLLRLYLISFSKFVGILILIVLYVFDVLYFLNPIYGLLFNTIKLVSSSGINLSSLYILTL